MIEFIIKISILVIKYKNELNKNVDFAYNKLYNMKEKGG